MLLRMSEGRIKFLLYIFSLLIVNTVCSTKKYQPDWSSLDKRPLPAWYDESKIGVFIHWGVYSVPSIGSEWFWYNWLGIYFKNQNSKKKKKSKFNKILQKQENNIISNIITISPLILSLSSLTIELQRPQYVSYMKKNYKEDFTYQQFAPHFTAELYNATQWALLLKDSGAKYLTELPTLLQ